MKRILLLLFTILSLSQAKASDTLTFRQIYNFNVGDTFDYKLTYSEVLGIFHEVPLSGYNFQRCIIKGKIASADSVTYIMSFLPSYHLFDTLVYTHLDSTILLDTLAHGSWQFTIGINSCDSVYNEIDVVDAIDETFYKRQYSPRLGAIYTMGGFNYPPTDQSTTDTTLIYFHTANAQCGTPYTIANNSSALHYTPIPEDCAVWNKEAGYYPYPYSLYEQIRTGAKHYQSNHTYVELIYRSYDSYLQTFTNDSLVGYFRNDTLGKKVWFLDSLSGSESLLYDFTLVSGDNITSSFLPVNYTVTLSAISVGGQTLDEWSYREVTPNYDIYNRNYVEGIGSLQGFLINKFPVRLSNYSPDIGMLTSFCVCGHTLYPDTASGQCALLTSISNIPAIGQIHLYPIPSIDQINLSFPDASQYNAKLIVTDLLGQQVYTATIDTSESSHDISKLSPGIFTWRLIDGNRTIKTGKIVKE